MAGVDKKNPFCKGSGLVLSTQGDGAASDGSTGGHIMAEAMGGGSRCAPETWHHSGQDASGA